VSVSDLRDEQWVVGRDTTPMLDVVLRVAHEAGFEPRVDLHSNDYQVILAAVAEGLGVALVPPLALVTEYPAVRLRPISDVEVRRYTVAAVRAGGSGRPAIAAALDALREMAGRVAAATPGVTVTSVPRG
jgi:DNA-binding transcriptional LysR family regulator